MSLGMMMMGGMVFGGLMSSAMSANSGITEACNQLKQAEEEYAKTKKDWNQALTNLESVRSSLKEYNIQLNNKYSNYKSNTKNLVSKFKLKQTYTNIFIGLIVFVLLFSLVLKYFHIYSSIWNFFTK